MVIGASMDASCEVAQPAATMLTPGGPSGTLQEKVNLLVGEVALYFAKALKEAGDGSAKSPGRELRFYLVEAGRGVYDGSRRCLREDSRSHSGRLSNNANWGKAFASIRDDGVIELCDGSSSKG